MLQAIIRTLIICSFTTVGYGQSSAIDTLLSFERRIFLATEQEKDLLLFQKLTYQLSQDIVDSTTLITANRIKYKHLPDSVRSRFLWNAALIAYFNSDKNLGLLYWKRYQKEESDSTTPTLFLGYLLSHQLDTAQHNLLLSQLVQRDSAFLNYENLANASYAVKAKKFKEVVSFIVPGTGLMLNGNVGKGALALGINSGIFFVLRYMIMHHAWINTALWGTNLIGKFYFGNVRLVQKEITKKEDRKKQKRTQKSALALSELLEKYPINFL